MPRRGVDKFDIINVNGLHVFLNLIELVFPDLKLEGGVSDLVHRECELQSHQVSQTWDSLTVQ